MSRNNKTKIIHYCNSPTRYLHGLVTEVDHQNLPFLYRLFIPLFKWWLRLFDLNAANNLTKKGAIWIGNSNFCSLMIKDIYKVDSQVIYPPIELDYFFNLPRLYQPKNSEILLKQQNLETQNLKKTSKNQQNKKLEFQNSCENDCESNSKETLQNPGFISDNYKIKTQENVHKFEINEDQKSELGLEKNSESFENYQENLEQKIDLENNELQEKLAKDSKKTDSINAKILENTEQSRETEINKKLQNEDYYYYFGRISFHKRLDLTILACLELGKKLKICGASAFEAEMTKLKNLVTDFETKNPDKIGLIQFLGRLNNDQRDLYLQYCRAFIFPAKEDFGIAPVEVLASGVPIIAYKAGGALEYVIEKPKKIPNLDKVILTENIQKLSENIEQNIEFENKNLIENNFNGVFFEEQNVQSLVNGIVEFEKIETWNTNFIRQSVTQFDQKYFENQIKKLATIL